MADGHSRPPRGRLLLTTTAAAAVLALVGACQDGGATVTPSGSSTTTAAATAAAPAGGIVLVDEGVTVVRGRSLPVTCNGKAPTDQAIADLNVPAVVASPGTRFRQTNGLTMTLCPGTTYRVLDAFEPPTGRDFIRYRVWVENNSNLAVNSANIASLVMPAGSDSAIDKSRIDDAAGVKATLGLILPGEVGTYEVVLAVPADGKDYVVAASLGGARWRARDGLTAGPPDPVALPAVTPVVTPKILPAAPAGLTADRRGYVLGPTDKLPHLCNGATPTKTVTIKDSLNDPAQTLDPGQTLEVARHFRITLCPGVDYQPSPAAYPSGGVTYRQYTAYISILEVSLEQKIGEFLPAVEDHAFVVPPGSGRVVDPTQIGYAPHVIIDTGQTAMVTFALAIPTTGGPYYLNTSAWNPSAYRLP